MAASSSTRLSVLARHLGGALPTPAPAAASSGKTVAIITGASSGIGEATVRLNS